ncbi:MAG TPA: 3-hydroxyacyl-CoA dehydrogenase family protein, partial [Candidatus Dormibacteraeota bacterium]|nr:3-hydroxyacyl-CoA dehydrogenase family protein [Candidatus Dormibacteraeota bacterium]
AGTMGSQIALQTALSGRYDVTLVDTVAGQLDRARAQNQKLLERSVEKGRVTKHEADEALQRIEGSNDLAKSALDADLVIEAVIENFDAKQSVFEALGKHTRPDALLASNSSTIAISRLADFSGRPERCCNMHFFHPVTVMQLCEIVGGPKTSQQTLQAAAAFVRSIDRTPVLLQKEIWGFIVNRILFAASEEAMRLLEGGYASAEDIDIAVQKGLNWPMGPFHLLDFSGLDVFFGAMQDRHSLGDGPNAPEVLRKLVEAGHLGSKSGKGFFDYPA